MGIDDQVNRTVIHHIVAAKDGAGRMPGNEYLKGDGRRAQAPLVAGERLKDAAADIGESINGAARKLR